VATLTVRNLDDGLVQLLHVRAAQHGRSVEAEHRDILRQVLTSNSERSARRVVAKHLEEFRRKTADRGLGSVEFLTESRNERPKNPAGDAYASVANSTPATSRYPSLR
jgi:plasmid stability protein